jgi:hypothetical protein
MKHEYHEGPKAGENFKALASAVFQAKKTTAPAKVIKKAVADGPCLTRQRRLGAPDLAFEIRER